MSQQTSPSQPAPPAPPPGPPPTYAQPQSSETQGAFMVQVSRPNDDRNALKNLIVGSFGLTGALVIGALVAGAVVAGVLIGWRKLRRGGRPEGPPTIGQIPLAPGATRPPSSPDQ